MSVCKVPLYCGIIVFSVAVSVYLILQIHVYDNYHKLIMLIFIGFFEKYIFDKFLKNEMQTDFKIGVLVKIYIYSLN